MDSKQFSEILSGKRVEAGISVDEMSERMQVTPYVVQDIELGVYNTYMELVMKYLNALNLHLVLISDAENKPITLSTYRELAKWCARKWPSYYQYCEGGMDVHGMRRMQVSGRGVEKNGIARRKFLELAEREGYAFEIVRTSDIPDLQVKHQKLLKAKKKKDEKDQMFGCLFLLVGLGAVGAFVYGVIWITLHLPEETFKDIGFIGALISLQPAFGLIFPFLIVAICLALVVCLIWFVIRWLAHSKSL